MDPTSVYSASLTTRVLSMYNNSRWTDCKFLVGTERKEVIEGHKAILASASPVFEAMFFSEMAERGTSPISIPDIHPVSFRTMLTYIYTDYDIIISVDEAFDVYYAAKKYILPNLEKRCAFYIELNLNLNNVCRVYEFALLYQEKLISAKCLEMISNNIKHIINSTSIEDVQLSTLVTIFSLVCINCYALEMFYAVERYVKAQNICIDLDTDPDAKSGLLECSSNSLESSKLRRSESTAESLKQDKESGSTLQSTGYTQKPDIRDVIKKIPFLTLTPQEFAEGPAKSNLLTKSEVLAIIMNIASCKTDIPMPSGFSTFRNQKKTICFRCYRSL